MATMLEVAKRAGVSKATVSRVLSGNGYVSQETKDRVFKAVAESGYRPNLLARNLATKTTQTLGLVVTNTLYHGVYFSELLYHVARMTEDKGRQLILADGKHSAQEEREAIQYLLDLRCDAIIIYPRFLTVDEMDEIVENHSQPIMVLNRRLRRHASHCVWSDQKASAMRVVERLIALGHRDIAYIRTDREVTLHFSVQGRFDSFMTCCKSNGVEPRVFVTDEGKNNISKVVTQLLSSDHMPTAIACQEDGIAIPLLFQLERNGFTIPNDISIIGYDDSTYARDLGLTTTRQTPVEMAHEAARMTLALIDKQPLDEPFKTFPAQLIVRSTTARLRH